MDLLQDLGWRTICAREIESCPVPPPRTVCLTFDDGYADNYRAFEELCRRGMRASWFIVSRDVNGKSSWPGESIPPQTILDVGQLREMADAGMEICSHTVSHCRLTSADDASVAQELNDSRAQLSDMLGKDVTTFAYPYGLYDNRIVQATRHAGYHVAFTANTGFGMIDDDLMKIRRITVFNSENLSAFARKLALGWHDVSWKAIAGDTRERVSAKIRSIFHA